MAKDYEIVFKENERKIIIVKDAGYHTIMMDEIIAFTTQINITLAKNEHTTSYLPIDDADLTSLDLFSKLSDGKVLAALINQIEPNTIDMRVLKYEGKSTAFKASILRENLSLVLNSLISLGISAGTVSVENFVDYKNSLHLILGIVWQVLKQIVLGKVDLHTNKNLVRLLEEGETINDLLALPPEKLLIRWVNHQLSRAGSTRKIDNLTNALKDGVVYIELLDFIGGGNAGLKKYLSSETSNKQRADEIVSHGKERYGIDTKVSSSFITTGLEKINLIFLASVYNSNPYLEEIGKKIDLEEDLEMDAERKAIRNWMTSMLPGEEIGELYETTSIGYIPLLILEKLGAEVNWKMIKKSPKNNLERIVNVGQAIEIARKTFNLRLIGFNEISMQEKNKKMVNDFFMLIMLSHSLIILKNLNIGGKVYEEKDVLNWVKENIKKVNEDFSVTGYGHSNWKKGLALIALLASFKSEVINWEYIKVSDQNEKEKLQNVSYALTIARKLGAVIFCGPETIVRGNSRMVQLFCIEVMRIFLEKK